MGKGDIVKNFAKAGAEIIKSTIGELTGQSFTVDGHTVLRFKGSENRFLIPDGYDHITDKKFVNAVKEMYNLSQKLEAVYALRTEHSFNLAAFFFPQKGSSMQFGATNELINDIHQSLSETQGLIEVKSGQTHRGYDYIYSIVKTVGTGEENPYGVRYFLRMNIGRADDVMGVYANFEEQGDTGFRESMVSCLADSLGIYKMGNDDWSSDPYDPNYRRGICKNLAEKEGLDRLCAGHPLSMAHEFIYAMLNDELVASNEKEDTPIIASEKEESADEVQKQKESNEFLVNLFVDECKVKTFTVEILEGKSEKGMPIGEEGSIERDSEDIESSDSVQEESEDKKKGIIIAKEQIVKVTGNIAKASKDAQKAVLRYIDEKKNAKFLCTKLQAFEDGMKAGKVEAVDYIKKYANFCLAATAVSKMIRNLWPLQ